MCCLGVSACAETSGENTTAPETAQSNEAESLPSRLWDPAKDILDLAGMQGLEMVPSWECANPVRGFELTCQANTKSI